MPRNDTDEARLERMAGGLLRTRYRDGQSLAIAMDRAVSYGRQQRELDRELAARRVRRGSEDLGQQFEMQ